MFSKKKYDVSRGEYKCVPISADEFEANGFECDIENSKFSIKSKMMSIWRPFVLLFLKETLSTLRHYFTSAFKILFPIALFGSILFARVYIGNSLFQIKKIPAHVNTAVTSNKVMCNNLLMKRSTLLYTWKREGKSKLIEDLLQLVATYANDVVLSKECNIRKSTPYLVFKPRPNEDIIIEECRIDDEDLFLGGIVFSPDFDYSTVDGSIPSLNYKLRFKGNLVVTLSTLYSAFYEPGPGTYGEDYSLFVSLQTFIDMAYIQLVTNQTLLPLSEDETPAVITSQQEMPYPSYLQNNVAFIFGIMLGSCMTMSISFSLPHLIKNIIIEKESGAKELLKMMGMPSIVHWAAWLAHAVVIFSISLVVIVILLCVKWKDGIDAILAFSNPFLVFVFFILYLMTLLSNIFAIAAFFSRPNIGSIICLCYFFGSYGILNRLLNDAILISMSFKSNLFLCLIPNYILMVGIKIIIFSEEAGTGLQWSNLFEEGSISISMGVIFIICFFNILFYFTIVWYVDKLFPGKYGVAEKWYFPFEFLVQQIKPRLQCLSNSFKIILSKSDDLFEEEPKDLTPGIEADGLSKVFCIGGFFYRSNLNVVKDVSFRCFKGHITVLLGHNGAGKTTTMSMLTGMYDISDGSATMNGFSVNSQMSKVRESLGLCPQTNMLFDVLTVREHLIFYGVLKGLKWNIAKREADFYLEKLDLSSKTNQFVSCLSGGMKRRLHLGIALIGDSKVVILDEPTSGLDPESRREIWNLLIEHKKGRTILLSTHFMEEADILGDRIIIMSQGSVKCAGTPFFLKKRLGSGYYLTVNKSTDTAWNMESIVNLVQSCVPNAVLTNSGSTGTRIVFNLPDSQTPQFPKLFGILEQNSDKLGVSNIGLNVPSIEDVFLSVEPDEHKTRPIIKDSTKLLEEGDDETDPDDRCSRLFKSQFLALMNKKLLVVYRNYLLYSLLALAPLLMAIISQLVVKSSVKSLDIYEPRNMTLNVYNDPVVYIYSSIGIPENMTSSYAYVVNEGSGKLIHIKSDMISQMQQDSRTNLALYRQTILAGVMFEFVTSMLPNKSTTILATFMYNSVPIHSRPISQSLLSNALLRYLLPSNNRTVQRKISTINHPLPSINELAVESSKSGVQISTFVYGFMITSGLGFLSASFVLLPVNERVSKIKQIQIMTGTSPYVYWLSNFVFDYIFYIISVLPSFVVLFLLDSNHYFSTNSAYVPIILIFVLSGFALISMAYVFSFLVNVSATGVSLILTITQIFGCITPMIWWMFKIMPTGFDLLLTISNYIRILSSFIPFFSIAKSIMSVITIQENNNKCVLDVNTVGLNMVCKKFTENMLSILTSNQKTYFPCCKKEFVDERYAICEQHKLTKTICHQMKTFLTWDLKTGINIDLIVIVANFVLFFVIVFAIESGFPSVLKDLFLETISSAFRAKINSVEDSETMDSDVFEESKKVERLTLAKYNHTLANFNSSIYNNLHLRACGLFKKFWFNLVAVNNLSFSVSRGECFGLLGVNGAGKTTAFRMLTGDEVCTRGSIHLDNYSLAKERRMYLALIGYCPQFDGIINDLTGREMIRLLGQLRGLSPSLLHFQVKYCIKIVGIEEYADRQCGTYSGGTKRKLSLAMSLIGGTSVLFLDEPTSGVDPVSKRNIWSIISDAKGHDKSIILTSHSMDECETLCDRLGIMVDGQFKCLGTVDHLKSKFGQGYTILLKLDQKNFTANDEDVVLKTKAITEFILDSFDGCFIKEQLKNFFNFYVADVTTTWQRLFSKMEEAKEKFGSYIEDYSISQTTLEQIFIKFAKQKL